MRECAEVGAGGAVVNTVPNLMKIGEARATTLDGVQMVVVGAAPHGLPVLLCRESWKLLNRLGVQHLKVTGRGVLACRGKSRPQLARLITNTTYDPNVLVRPRNGNMLDLRLQNIAVIPRGLLQQAALEAREPRPVSPTITLADGRVRTRRRRVQPPASERIANMLHPG